MFVIFTVEYLLSLGILILKETVYQKVTLHAKLDYLKSNPDDILAKFREAISNEVEIMQEKVKIIMQDLNVNIFYLHLIGQLKI